MVLDGDCCAGSEKVNIHAEMGELRDFGGSVKEIFGWENGNQITFRRVNWYSRCIE
jgi:hypothetical protein